MSRSESCDLQVVSWDGEEGGPSVYPPSILQLDMDVGTANLSHRDGCNSGGTAEL